MEHLEWNYLSLSREMPLATFPRHRAGCTWSRAHRPGSLCLDARGGRLGSDIARTQGGTEAVSLKSGSNQEGMNTSSTPGCALYHKHPPRRSFPWYSHRACPTPVTNSTFQSAGPSLWPCRSSPGRSSRWPCSRSSVRVHTALGGPQGCS